MRRLPLNLPEINIYMLYSRRRPFVRAYNLHEHEYLSLQYSIPILDLYLLVADKI